MWEPNNETQASPKWYSPPNSTELDPTMTFGRYRSDSSTKPAVPTPWKLENSCPSELVWAAIMITDNSSPATLTEPRNFNAVKFASTIHCGRPKRRHNARHNLLPIPITSTKTCTSSVRPKAANSGGASTGKTDAASRSMAQEISVRVSGKPSASPTSTFKSAKLTLSLTALNTRLLSTATRISAGRIGTAATTCPSPDNGEALNSSQSWAIVAGSATNVVFVNIKPAMASINRTETIITLGTTVKGRK